MRKSIAICTLTGLVWGVSTYIFTFDGSTEASLILALVLTGLAAGTYSLLSPVPTLVAAFVIPCMTPMIILCLIYGELAMTMLSLLGVVFVLALIRGARISAEYFENMFRYADDAAKAQTRLGAALDCSGDAIAIFDQQGALSLANDAFRKQFEGVDNFSKMPAEGVYHNKQSGAWSIGKLNKTSDGGSVVIHTEITELKNAEELSHKARKSAEEASRAKTQFLAAISHELRTPLNSVIGYSDLLRKEALGALGVAEYKDYSDKISESGRRLLRKINDIIDLTKFEARSSVLEKAPVSAKSVIELATEISRRSTNDSRHVNISIEEEAETIYVDENACQLALEHVLRNAFKYTPREGEIDIRAFMATDGPVIQVQDAGSGIPFKYLAHVREPFLQVQSTYNRAHEGLGLGLAVAQSIMRAHNGSLDIESVEGVGTIVNLRFSSGESAESAIPERAAAS